MRLTHHFSCELEPFIDYIFGFVLIRIGKGEKQIVINLLERKVNDRKIELQLQVVMNYVELSRKSC